MSSSSQMALSQLYSASDNIQKLFELFKQVEFSCKWKWKYEESESFSQISDSTELIITDIRDWFDMNCTERACFQVLSDKLHRSVKGCVYRINLKRTGRKVQICDCLETQKPDVIIICL